MTSKKPELASPARSSTWLRSSSCDSSACLEVLFLGQMVALRDSNHPDRQVFVSNEDYDRFTEGVKRGDLDRPR